MNPHLQSILDLILSNDHLSQEERDRITRWAKEADKMLLLSDFKLTRAEKEKRSVGILLEETIEELQKKTLAAEQSNVALKQTLDELKETQQQLVMSEKMASLGQLTAGVAHEINNPINFVSASIKPLRDDLKDIMSCFRKYEEVIHEKELQGHFTQVIQFRDRLDIDYSIKEVEDLLQGIEEGATRTTEIVKSLRNFSRLDQHDLKKADINEGLESTLILLNSTYKNRIEIVRNYGNIPEVDCYPGQINQVFMNILANAVQAIPEEGKIFITTTAVQDEVIISIKDTGTGIDEEVRNRIFDPFFTTKEVGKGTGLGLSISYSIIKKHKGSIEVRSSKGEGTEFIISLPIRQLLTTTE